MESSLVTQNHLSSPISTFDTHELKEQAGEPLSTSIPNMFVQLHEL